MTISDAVFAAVDRFERAGCESPRLDAELLMACSLHLTRPQLYARCHQEMSIAQEDAFEALVARRAAREPLAYIVGHKEFYGLEFAVDRRVLIPRPETEHLVEQALVEVHRITAFRRKELRDVSDRDPLRIVDVGAGSGAIAISLAVKLPTADVIAADLSADALDVVMENGRRHQVQDRVHPVQSDLLSGLAGSFDLIAANLPYINGTEWATLAPEITQFEPQTALYGGPDGLDAIRRLISQIAESKAYQGLQTSKVPKTSEVGLRAILLEIGSTQGEAVTSLAHEMFPAAEVFIVKDYAELDRVVVVRL